MQTVAQLIDRFISEMNGTREMVGIKPLGESHYCTLRRLQREPIGAKVAAELKKQDVMDFARARRVKVMPATINQDITYLSGVLKYAGSAWDEENITAAAIDAARPMLVKLNLVGKATPRKERPTDEQIARLRAYFDERASHGKVKLKRMGDLIEFAIRSSRRRGELCRMTHGDVDYEKKIYWVRDVKHPRMKKGNHKAFILWPELEEIIRRQPRLNAENPNERIWPYQPPSVTQAYIAAKKRLGIKGIRFHDNRGRAISEWLLKMPPEDVRLAVSGHNDTRILETVYDRRSPSEILQAKYQRFMQAAP